MEAYTSVTLELKLSDGLGATPLFMLDTQVACPVLCCPPITPVLPHVPQVGCPAPHPPSPGPCLHGKEAAAAKGSPRMEAAREAQLRKNQGCPESKALQ